MITFLILLISCLFVFKNQRYLVLIFSFTASNSDSFITNELLSLQLPLFTRIMEALLFAATFVGLWQNRKRLNHPQKTYIKLALYFILCISIISFIKYGTILKLPEVGARIINFSVQYGPAVFILLLSTLHTFNFKRYLYLFLGSHMLLSILVIYGPYMNFPYLEFLKFSFWHPEDIAVSSTISDPMLIRGEIMSTLFNKYIYYVDSCFHNPNILGFYAGSFALVSLLNFLHSKYNFFYFMLFIIGMTIWFDAGTKAPLVAMLIIIFIYYYKSLKKNIFLALGLIGLLPLLLYGVFYAYETIFVYSVNASFESRQSLIVDEYEFFINHFFLGQTLKDTITSPHQLFLLYGTTFGIFAMLISIVFIYVKPFIDTLNHFSVPTVGLYALLFFMGITDNFTAISLYMLLFTYLVAEFMNNKPQNIIENESQFT